MTQLTISIGCVNLVKQFEGFKSKAYPDPATNGEPYTIGYGSTRYANGDKVKLGEMLTMPEAERLLIFDLERRLGAIRAWLPYQMNQNQVDSVLSFVYNCGVGAFEKSTLRKLIWDNPHNPIIRQEFMKWTRANSKVMKGLQNRRAAESELYFKPV